MAYTYNNGKVAIPKLDRGPPPPIKPPLAHSREDRVYVYTLGPVRNARC